MALTILTEALPIHSMGGISFIFVSKGKINFSFCLAITAFSISSSTVSLGKKVNLQNFFFYVEKKNMNHNLIHDI